jgi:hypothetical protein
MDFTKKEITWLIIITIILAFIIGFTADIENETASITVIIPLITAAIIILVNVIPKKIVAPIFSIKIEHKPWEFKRYGWYSRSRLKKPFPIGIILPFILSFLSLGYLKMFTLLQFDYENIPQKRILKRVGRRNQRRTEINDSDLGYTAAVGLYSLFALAIIASLFNLDYISKYTVFYGCWNLIPFGNLDGSKIFFGTTLNWGILVVLFFILGLPLIFIIA